MVSKTFREGKMEILFYEGSEERFKKEFLNRKTAIVKIYSLKKPKPIIKEWRLINFTQNSSVRGNLLSGYLKGWKKKGFYQAKVGCFF